MFIFHNWKRNLFVMWRIGCSQVFLSLVPESQKVSRKYPWGSLFWNEAPVSQPAFTFSKLAIETLEQDVTRTTPLTSFWFLYCYFWTYFKSSSSVSIVNFEHVILDTIVSTLYSPKVGLVRQKTKAIAMSD